MGYQLINYDYMNSTEFTADQKQEIEKGMLEGLNVELYARPEYLAIQMFQIRLGLEERLPVESYASPDFDWFQMEEIRLGLKSRIDISKYASKDIPFDVMRQIRKGLEQGIDLSDKKHYSAGVLRQLRRADRNGIDISKYVEARYEEEQLNEIRIALEKGINIDPYINPSQRGAFIREIALGLEKNLDISSYIESNMNWQQLRELRLGMEERLNVDAYKKVLYSWQQMREIRLGLEQGLPVEEYSSLMYTAKEMHIKREALARAKQDEYDSQKETIKFSNFILLISESGMEAYILASEIGEKIDKMQILNALKEENVTVGIDYAAIDRLADVGAESEMVIVARGVEATEGKDGWYEFMFETDIKSKPKLLENGSVDYMNIKWFELVKKDQIIARYHSATQGTDGRRITGEIVHGTKGKEIPPIRGYGFKILPDKKTYVAGIDGKVELKEGNLILSNVLFLDDVNGSVGNIEFNGSINIRGNISDGVTIKAARDIVVEGFTECANIEAGGDVVLKQGNNPGGKGYIKAGNDVSGRFFENAKIIAGGNVQANYCLNSEVYAEKQIEIWGRIGMLAGGNVFAGEGVSSYYIGNTAGVDTYIKVGIEQKYYNEIAELEDRKQTIERELVLLRNAYMDIRRKYKPEERNINPMFIKMESAIYTKKLELKDAHDEADRLRQEENKIKQAKIIVQGTIYRGVRINVNGALWNAKETNNVTIKKSKEGISIYRNL